MEIVCGLIGVFLAFWLVKSCERGTSRDNSFDPRYDPRESRLEAITNDLVELPADERNGRLLRLEQEERELVEMKLRSRNIKDFISYYLRAARPSDYEEWLRGYYAKGGTATHRYDYKLPDDFFIAVSDFRLPAWYGSQSINVIVPPWVTVDCPETGHNKLFYLIDFSCRGFHNSCSVSLYVNVIEPPKSKLN